MLFTDAMKLLLSDTYCNNGNNNNNETIHTWFSLNRLNEFEREKYYNIKQLLIFIVLVTEQIGP